MEKETSAKLYRTSYLGSQFVKETSAKLYSLP